MKLGSTIILAAAFGAAIYVGLGIYSGAAKVGGALGAFAWWTAGAGLALAATNYLLRFAKWELYLRRLGVKIPARDSLEIFLSGFSLTVTPGKVGEVLKSYLLREMHGVPMARTAPTVVAERVTDLIALVLLALTGVGALAGAARIVWIAAAMVVLLLAVVSSRRLSHALIDVAAKLPVIGSLAPKLREFYDATAVLLAPGPLAAATAISVAAWACECIAFWIILRGFPGADASLLICTFIYAAMTIAGALSFLPGGLGVQEGGMVALLLLLTHGLDDAKAVAATFVTRMCTLWFAVAVGLVALALVRRRTRVDLDAVAGARQSA